MKETVFDISYNIFYEVSQKKEEDIDFNLSNKLEYPKIDFIPRVSITMPQPIEFSGKYFFEGIIFDSYDDYHKSIWSLYLASIYHIGAHANVSDYTKYEYWMQDKTPEKGWKVIDFVEDIKVKEYLRNFFPEAWENVAEIDSTFNELYKVSSSNHVKKNAREDFKNLYVNNPKEISELKEKLSHTDNLEFSELVPYLDFLYKNLYLLPENVLPFYEHRNFKKHFSKKWKNVIIHPKGEFIRFVENIDELWLKEKHSTNKMMRQYDALARNLQFDKIEINTENFGDYLRVRNESSKLLKKLRNQLKLVSNVINDPSSMDVGMIEMQKAIQAEAMEDSSVQIFEQDTNSRQNENWVIIFDTSASMKLKFEEMKKLTLCLSETADELNANKGKWGMYSFNNDFLVVKDHGENYNQQVKARIGGIENKGLSLIPDAITMGTRILNADLMTEKKYLIIITDGQSLGYSDIDESYKTALANARKAGISIIGIGLPEGTTKYYSATINDTELRKTVANFIESYTSLSQS